MIYPCGGVEYRGVVIETQEVEVDLRHRDEHEVIDSFVLPRTSYADLDLRLITPLNCGRSLLWADEWAPMPIWPVIGELIPNGYSTLRFWIDGTRFEAKRAILRRLDDKVTQTLNVKRSRWEWSRDAAFHLLPYEVGQHVALYTQTTNDQEPRPATCPDCRGTGPA